MWKFSSVFVCLCALAFASDHEVKGEVKQMNTDMTRFVELVEGILVLFEKGI